LTNHHPGPWDGNRPLSPRRIVERARASLGRMEIVAATENLAAPTDWTIEQDRHTIVVHLDGRLDRMECIFANGPSGPALPVPGDIWMIPAACRYAALAQGEFARFVEISLPPALIANAALPARVRHRDPFLAAAAARLSELIADPDDDVAAMAAHAIGQAVEFHLRHRYGRASAPASQPAGLDARARALLTNAIHGALDDPHDLAGLAARVGMDVRRFTTAFRASFGCSPWQYILDARLAEGARLLREERRPVTDIALAVGFATPSHFTSRFTRRFGVPPSRYRQLAASGMAPSPPR
jgi:AraC family transcriptional regulator